MKLEHAIETAQKAIEFYAGHEDALNALMAQTGLGPDDFRDSLEDASFLAGLLDFLFQHEPFLLDFCEHVNESPEFIIKVRRALPGGEMLWDG